jgi:hypothetical protein
LSGTRRTAPQIRDPPAVVPGSHHRTRPTMRTECLLERLTHRPKPGLDLSTDLHAEHCASAEPITYGFWVAAVVGCNLVGTRLAGNRSPA